MMRSLALALVAVASASAFVAPNGFTIKATRTVRASGVGV
jgi:hypothetical protein